MTRTYILDQANDASIAQTVVDALEEAGYQPEEAIPGLIQAILALAEVTSDPEQALDEAAALLADGPVEAEGYIDEDN